MKRFLLTILALTILLGAASVFSLSVNAEELTSGYYTYSVKNNEATLEHCTENIKGDVQLPSTLGGYPVVKISGHAFTCCDQLTSVVIPNSVTSIGWGAFSDCSGLTSVTIPSSVTNIGMEAFYNCHNLTEVHIFDLSAWCNIYFYEHISNPLWYARYLYINGELVTDLIIPNSVTNIADYAFSGCFSFTSVTIPNSVTNIGNSAFSACTRLTEVTIGDSVISIGEDAFSGCVNMTAIKVDEKNANYSSANGVLFNKDKTTLIQYPEGKSGGYTIPNSVTSIRCYAFRYCDRLTTVTIPNSITTIDSYAFFYCTGLTEMTIPSSVTSIGRSAFSRCTNLTKITIPSSVTTIGDSAFSDCTNLTKITIPSSVTTIGDSAFSDCTSLTKITIPSSVTSIGRSAFSRCTSLATVTIPNSITTIDSYAFSNCTNLTKITIPSSVTTIGDSAFYGCTWLTELIIGNSVTRIQSYAFYNCGNLRNVWYAGSSQRSIDIRSYNTDLTYATWHYNMQFVDGHIYNNVCDAICNICDYVRAAHIYDNACDATCTHCGYVREAHIYSNVCDKSCNVCGTTRSVSGHSYKKVIVKKATTTANGSYKNVCTKCGYTASKVTTLYKASKISLSTTSYTYTGSVKKPSVVVKDSMGKTVSSKYYTVTYASGRKNVGTYKVTVKFKGNYSGTKTLTFKINPAKTTLGTLTAAKKALTVKWTKKSTQVTGYQIQYSTSKSFKSYKTKTVSSYKTTSTKLTGLSAKKTYYVRVRTYKKVGGVTYYSGWSTIKYKKTK